MRKNSIKNVVILGIVASFLFITIPSKTVESNEDSNLISFTVILGDFSIKKTEIGDEIIADNYGRLLGAGAPTFPFFLLLTLNGG